MTSARGDIVTSAASAASAARAASRSVAALLEEVVRLSHRFGLDPEFARGGGGNSSGKADGIVYIKPSGLSLAALSVDALMPLRMAPLLELLDDGADAPATPGTDEIMRVALLARVHADDDRRPSVECLFHALLPDPIVLHTHPTVVNALACASDGERLAAEIFGNGVLWVPYVDPGLPLARRIAAERRAFEERTGNAAPRAMLLQNHGLIVTGETAEDVGATCERLVEAVRRRLVPGEASSPVPPTDPGRTEATVRLVAPALRWLLATGDRPKIVTFDDGPAAQEIASTPAGRDLVLGGPLTPDQIVYAGSWPLWLEPIHTGDTASAVDELRRRIGAHAASTGAPPAVVVAAGIGLFIIADSARFATTAREVLLDAMRISQGAQRLGGLRVMTPVERAFIEDWEAEAYRRGVEAGAAGAGLARGLVALVVGAGSDVGSAVAADLAQEGAHVVLADIGAAAVEAQARQLNDRVGPGRAVAVVIDPSAVDLAASTVLRAIRHFGGLDLAIQVAADDSDDVLWAALASQAVAVQAIQAISGASRAGAVLEVDSDEIVRRGPDGRERLARRGHAISWPDEVVRLIRDLVGEARGSAA